MGISKGTIEILNDVKLIKMGDKVGASESALLNMLKISPFKYGLGIEQVYDSGTIFDPAILDVTDDDLRGRFMMGVANVAAAAAPAAAEEKKEEKKAESSEEEDDDMGFGL